MFGRRILSSLLGELKEVESFKGPLGVWPYPIINLAFKVLKIIKER